MQSYRLLVVVVLLAGTTLPSQRGGGSVCTAAESLPERHRIQDRGQVREFEVARDEVWHAGMAAPQRVQSVPPQVSLAALRRQADQLAGQTGEETDLVLYEAGQPRSDQTRRLLTREVALRLQEGTDPAALARQMGVRNWRPVPGLPGWHVFLGGAAGQALELFTCAPRIRNGAPSTRRAWRPSF